MLRLSVICGTYKIHDLIHCIDILTKLEQVIFRTQYSVNQQIHWMNEIAQLRLIQLKNTGCSDAVTYFTYFTVDMIQTILLQLFL